MRGCFSSANGESGSAFQLRANHGSSEISQYAQINDIPFLTNFVIHAFLCFKISRQLSEYRIFYDKPECI